MSWTAAPIPGGWKYTDADTQAEIVLDFIHPTARGLDAWVELRVQGDEIPVAEGTRNLMAAKAYAPFLEDAQRIAKDVDWQTGLRQAFHEAVLFHRDGAATVDLADVEPEPLQFLLEPLVEHGGMTRLIAAGGSGKSLLAMAASLSVATGRRFLGLTPVVEGPVLYLDWETDASTHARRIKALCEPLNLDAPDKERMLYRYESVPLTRSAQSVRRICEKYGVVMVVVDSAKMAAGPSGLGGSSAEDSTLNLYLALREIGRPGFIIDHKSKEDIFKGRRGGYGSVFYENLARMQWEMTKLVDLSPTERSFVLELEKENNVGRMPPLGFKLETSGGAEGIRSAQFIQQDPHSLPDPDADDMVERIFALLGGSDEPLTVNKIADMLYGVEEGKRRKSSIRTRLNQDDRFENVSESNVGLWRLEGAGPVQSDLDEQLEHSKPQSQQWEGDVF